MEFRTVCFPNLFFRFNFFREFRFSINRVIFCFVLFDESLVSLFYF